MRIKHTKWYHGLLFLCFFTFLSACASRPATIDSSPSQNHLEAGDAKVLFDEGGNSQLRGDLRKAYMLYHQAAIKFEQNGDMTPQTQKATLYFHG